MKNIVILGCENSHANSFLSIIKKTEKFADVNVLGVYSDERVAAERLNATFGVAVMDTYDQFVGKVDGVIVTARHGDNHYKYAKPYISSGMCFFIDKPVTISGDEALEFMQKCKAVGAKVTGGSCLKYADFIKELANDVANEVDGKTIGGSMRGPVKMNNPYGGFYFYAQHLVEMVTTPYGNYPNSISAYKTGNNINAIFHYDGFDVNALFTDEIFTYFGSRYAEKANKSADFSFGDEAFFTEFDEFYDLVDGKDQKISYEDFIAPVFILNAIESAVESGKEQPVRRVTL